ncbi:hypothetical protein J4470_05500 [Candidatus Woesearchaeota archaeon]|nr:hypothetical protein [Candidatus Woesearchaeota archaeon]
MVMLERRKDYLNMVSKRQLYYLLGGIIARGFGIAQPIVPMEAHYYEIHDVSDRGMSEKIGGIDVKVEEGTSSISLDVPYGNRYDPLFGLFWDTPPRKSILRR